MKKETAVQWLIDQVEDYIGLIPVDIIDQAKVMEKEQIIKAAIVSHFEGVRQLAKTSKEYLEYGEQYYNETYEKRNRN